MKATFMDPEGNEIAITQATRREWVPYLVMVLTNPHRYVGLLSVMEGDEWQLDERPVILEHVCVYASQIGFQPDPSGQGVKIMGNRLVIPFDGLAPIRALDIYDIGAVIVLNNEPEDSMLRNLIVDGYANLFDPSQLIRPTPDVAQKVLNS